VVASRIEKLANELLELDYDKTDRAGLIDIYRTQIASKSYEKALSTLNAFRLMYKEEYGPFHKVLGVQDEAYIKIQLEKIRLTTDKVSFDEILDSIYKNVDSGLKEDSFFYFDLDFKTTKSSYQKSLLKTKKSDSITKKEATYLCRIYASYLTALEIGNKGKLYAQKEERKKFIIEDSLFIRTRDNAKLSATIYRKRENTKPLPVILMFSIYPDHGDFSSARMSVHYGYVGVTVNTRGKRYSSNEIVSFEKDSEDLYDAIDWISKQPWCNGKIGMYGGSYLGFAQWAVNKNPHPALKTIVPMVAVGPGIDYPMYNNVFMSYMLRWIHYVENNKFTDDVEFRNEKKWDSLYLNWYKKGIAFNALDSLDKRQNKTFQRWLSHPSYDAYWQNMMPYKKDFSKINIPVLTFTGYYDSDQVGALHYFKEHHKYNSNANHSLVIGPYDHYGAQGGIEKVLKGYKIDSVANIIRQVPMSFKWFDHILKDSIKPDFLKNKVNYQVMGTNEWKSKSSIDKVANDTLKFYLDNTLKDKHFKLVLKKPEEKGFIKEEVDFLERDKFLIFKKYPEKILDTILSPQSSNIFVSEAFKDDFEINGSFNGIINLIINKKDLDINIELYELTSNNKYFALSTYLGRASYAKNRSKRNLLKPNKEESIPIRNSSFTSKLIKKGSKLIVIVAVNKNPYWQINYGSGRDVSVETIDDGKLPLQIKWLNTSTISIPVYRYN